MTSKSTNRRVSQWTLFLGLIVCCAPVFGQTPLLSDFQQPPKSTRPWCYWYWISDNISREGLTKDLEAMAQAGIGEALIGNVFFDDTRPGDIKVLSEPWWELVEHAIREGGRVGVDIALFNSPGWSQSGGPWIKPEQAMRYLVSSELRVTGPRALNEKLPVPAEPYQDVAVLAFPAPVGDADTLVKRSPELRSTPEGGELGLVCDGDRDTVWAFPAGAGKGEQPLTLEIALAEPLTVRHLALTPGQSAWAAQCELQVADDAGSFHSVRTASFDRSNMSINVGPMPRGPVIVSFAPVTGRTFRLVFSGVSGEPALAEIELSPAARVEAYIEKQLGKMHPTPSPTWGTYLWPDQTEPDDKMLSVPADQVINLTSQLQKDGTLQWDVPAGDWVVLRTGMTTTGTKNSPASPEGTGLEVDKMNRQAAAQHFDAFIGELLRRMPTEDRRALKHVVADSYEMGSQNWTDDLAPVFQERFGYDPLPWLPVLTGRVVGTADQSNRFLWDLRRLVADRVATEYVGGLRDLCREQGLQLWLENYGHWGFPAEFLQYGGQSDNIGGEFWLAGLGLIECRAASSAGNTYGFPRVSAEAFTSGGPLFRHAPTDLKARGDWAFCQGINHFVLHVYIHQPWEDRRPGVNAWFGTEFNRHNTWFSASHDWVDYLRRCCLLLQQGARVADVAYFIGEDAPKMTGAQDPELPPGYDFDYINAEVIQAKLQVQDGLLTLPTGTAYRVLVLPDMASMRPEVLEKIKALIEAGATVIGPPPVSSPSLQDFPRCDARVRELAEQIWGPFADRQQLLSQPGSHELGKGRVIWGQSLADVLASVNCPADFTADKPLLFTHRHLPDQDIYFVSNQRPEELVVNARFRVQDVAPELWWPETGRKEQAALYESTGAMTCVPLHLPPQGSVFVIFRKSTSQAERIVAISQNGQQILDARQTAVTPAETDSTASARVQDSFTLAVWAKPAVDTTLPAESNSGAAALGVPRNDAVFPQHGSMFGAGTRAGCGVAVGRNGVTVLEHGASYFSPLLVHSAKLDDWTHVAVVYSEGQPSLYLNGALVRTGLKSQYTVHPTTTAGGGGSFVGEIGAIEMVPRALEQADVAQLMASMVKPGAHPVGSAVRVARDAAGRLRLESREAGEFALERADGSRRTARIDRIPAPIAIAGPWQVRFDPKWRGPQQVNFKELVDWTQRPEDGIRFYSGTATYSTKFVLPSAAKPGQRLWLDLGTVRELATVRVNGKALGTLWKTPWRVDVTTAVQAGDNQLEVDVVNPWHNRIVGDLRLPESERCTYLALPVLQADAPLVPAGLLGPVRIESTVQVEVK
jgi:hypothetical protein